MKKAITKWSLILSLFLSQSHLTLGQTFIFDSKVVADLRFVNDHVGHHGGNAIFGDYMVAGAHYAEFISGADTTATTGTAFLYHWDDEECIWDQIDQIYAESAIGVFDIEI